MKKKSNSYFHSLQLALQLQEEERREQQQRQQQQQQRTQSRPQPARGSPSRSNILPQSQQQSSNSNQQRAESAVRQFVYKKDTTFIGGQVCCEAQCLYGIFCQVLISLCTSNVRKISNFRDFFFFFSKYPSRVTEVSLTGGEETVLESVKFDFKVSQTFVCKNNSKYSYTSMLIQSNFGKV